MVYGPHERVEKVQFWQELKELKARVVMPLLFIGDFNEVLQPNERKGGYVVSNNIRDFREWV